MTSTLTSPYDEPSTDHSLLRRAQSGHDEGWQTLVQIYGPIVYRWIRRLDVQPADAADVMQETFLAVATALPRFDAVTADATFRGWLWTIARNKLRDRQRREGRQPTIDGSQARRLIEQVAVPAIDDVDPPSSQEDDAKLARSRTLELMRQSFDPRSWRMFWETMVEDRDPQDVADEMNVSRWAVYKARARVLQRLRQELDGLA